MRNRPLRSWQIQLEHLDDSEMDALEKFFVEQMGVYSSFTFPDPYSGVAVPHCRFANGLWMSELLGVDIGSTTIIVIETNG
jgi:hypothetical protein